MTDWMSRIFEWESGTLLSDMIIGTTSYCILFGHSEEYDLLELDLLVSRKRQFLRALLSLKNSLLNYLFRSLLSYSTHHNNDRYQRHPICKLHNTSHTLLVLLH